MLLQEIFSTEEKTDDTKKFAVSDTSNAFQQKGEVSLTTVIYTDTGGWHKKNIPEDPSEEAPSSLQDSCSNVKHKTSDDEEAYMLSITSEVPLFAIARLEGRSEETVSAKEQNDIIKLMQPLLASDSENYNKISTCDKDDLVIPKCVEAQPSLTLPGELDAEEKVGEEK